MKTHLYLLIVFLSLFSMGCQQRVATLLAGKWEGRPDTAAERENREAEKYGDRAVVASESTATVRDATDWEAYDISITIEFVSRSEIKFALQGETEPVEGTWSILQSGPSGCTIEVKTPTGVESTVQLRRYRLELDQRENELHGFLLTEVGADRGLGALYFERPGAGQ